VAQENKKKRTIGRIIQIGLFVLFFIVPIKNHKVTTI